MNTVRNIHVSTCHHRARIFFFATTALFSSTLCQAGPVIPTTKNDAFYHQLLKLPESEGYKPTRTFTIINDPEHGDQLVAEDDPNLRFNLLWMEQFRPGYRTRSGGSALGEVFRSYVKSAYKAYRTRNAQGGMMKALPDENGSLGGKSNYSGEMDYNVKVTDDEVRFKVQYSF